MFLSRYRRTIDTYAPFLGQQYRLLRDATIRRHPIPTKHGFVLAGDPSMARDDWETTEIEAFLELIESHDAVVDIGANIGFYSCLAASRGKHAIAFEPSPRNLSFLYRNLSDNQFSDVEVFPLGLAGKSGLGRMRGYGDMSSFVPGWAQAHDAKFRLVPLTTLDTHIAGRFANKKLLIKMDVEGFEMEVLAGATKTLSMIPKPTWLIEILLRNGAIPGGISRTFSETFDVFWAHGYRCRKLDAGRTSVTQPDVSSWVARGCVDSKTHDFLFSAD